MHCPLRAFEAFLGLRSGSLCPAPILEAFHGVFLMAFWEGRSGVFCGLRVLQICAVFWGLREGFACFGACPVAELRQTTWKIIQFRFISSSGFEVGLGFKGRKKNIRIWLQVQTSSASVAQDTKPRRIPTKHCTPTWAVL